MIDTMVAIEHRADIPRYEEEQQSSVVASIRDMIERMIAGLGGIREFVRPGDAVFIKPNLVTPEPPWTGVNTDPRVLEALVGVLKDAGARRVTVGEHQRWQGPGIFSITGAAEACRRAGAEVAVLDDEEHVKVDIPGGECEHFADLPRVCVESDVIVNLPKMKTHLDTKVSLSLKNLMGLVPSDPYGLAMHGHLAQSLVDLYGLLTPALNIVDGLIALEGHGPLFGKPVSDMNVLVAGANAVAVDSVCSAVMGMDPWEVDSTRMAAVRGLGPANIGSIQTVGAKIEDVQREFARAINGPLAYMRYDGYTYPVQVYLGATCQGCQGAIREQLDQLTLLAEIEGIPSAKRRPLVIIAGKNACVPVDLPEAAYVWVMGDCAAEHRNQGCFDEGCPPGPNTALGPECIGVPLTWPVMGRFPH